jgi:oligopeptide/dipeptide ABC transporter ATP-binding protein
MIDDGREALPPLLSVNKLSVSFRVGSGVKLPVIDTANFDLDAQGSLGLVGESGSGKTMLCRALIGTLARHGAVINGGSVSFAGQPITNLGESEWRKLRGHQIGYVPQSSMAGLNPILTIKSQLSEVVKDYVGGSEFDVRREVLELLERVRIPRPTAVMRSRPHQLSGGMRQRVIIAAAIAQRPKLLIADEPTTALDVTVQSEILALINELREELGMALLLVSHDLAVIEEMCSLMAVMYAGATVEVGPTEDLISSPNHPYTRALNTSRTDRARPGELLESIPGDAVSVGHWPKGCRFWPRCPIAEQDCQDGLQPELLAIEQHASACIHSDRMGVAA